MHLLKIGKKNCVVYELDEAKRRGVSFRSEWRGAEEGDWIATDTGYVMQVLKTGLAGKTRWIRVASGTWPEVKGVKLSHKPKKDRYIFGDRRGDPAARETTRAFVQIYARVPDPKLAWMMSHPKSVSTKRAKKEGKRLTKMPKVQEMIRDERELVLKRLGIDREWLYKEMQRLYKEVASSDKIGDRTMRLRILESFAETFERMTPKVMAEWSSRREFIPGEDNERLEESERRRLKVEGRLHEGNGDEAD